MKILTIFLILIYSGILWEILIKMQVSLIVLHIIINMSTIWIWYYMQFSLLIIMIWIWYRLALSITVVSWWLGLEMYPRYFTKINEVNMEHFNFSTKIHTPNYMIEKIHVEHLNASQTDQIYVVLLVIIKYQKFVHLIV